MGEDNFSQNTAVNKIKRPWYKTGVGIVFLGFVSLILLVSVTFAGFVSYYAWQLKYGDAEKLVQQFSTEKFTQDPGLAISGDADIAEKDLNKYIRDHNPVWGQGDKPVTIISFIDFECPFCLESYPIFKSVTSKYKPIVKVVFKHLPLENLHPGAEMSANAAACADEQDKFWDYYDGLFLDNNHAQVGLTGLAEKIGLNSQNFTACLGTKKYQKNINQDLTDAVELGLIGTPTYFVNGYKVEGALGAEQWEQIILQAYNN
ncbi:MAG: DsbA family protein [Candidatus Magasanikbacteria bacterium]|jgi:protein-disulfide isomerase|nr:DsbA family protein [Candidatus Magasanikbacteria bacterium]MBT4314862.1 DsbA family protein [Candidatus Magasanikbacteria bacterium]MBT4546751.1 DsbA family protein [Candidatus Magasanikbacteria bacterium]MBT6819640.1 DsbA family protein [Candidatus Magasanikbacteria bacterium]